MRGDAKGDDFASGKVEQFCGDRDGGRGEGGQRAKVGVGDLAVRGVDGIRAVGGGEGVGQVAGGVGERKVEVVGRRLGLRIAVRVQHKGHDERDHLLPRRRRFALQLLGGGEHPLDPEGKRVGRVVLGPSLVEVGL